MALEWVQKGSLKGPQGDKGDTGEQGEDGRDGASFRACSVDLSGNEDVSLSNVTPSEGVAVGDMLVDPEGDVYEVASLGSGTVHTGTDRLLNIRGPQGEQGEQGEAGADGKDGTGVTILGSYDSEEALKEEHPTGSAGDAYLIDGDLYVWSETSSSWNNVGTIQGPQGEKGDKGEAGADATVTVGTTSTGEAGSNAQVSATGDGTSNVTLNFTIPRGDKGDTGAAGPGVSVGTGSPTSEGQAGECYIDVSTGNLYRYEDSE